MCNLVVLEGGGGISSVDTSTILLAHTGFSNLTNASFNSNFNIISFLCNSNTNHLIT